MTAFIVDRYAKDAPLRLGDVPQPSAGDRDVLVEVHAAALSLLDSKIATGEFNLCLC